MNIPVKSPRKLIEVALPLDAINEASAREKSIRQGHPSTLHLWWARRPLAAARAVIFAQFVNDPGFQQGGGFKYGTNKKDAAIERKRLFQIIEELVQWKNTNNEELLERAREEIRRSWCEVCELNKDHPLSKELFDPEKLPGLHDPFAGGGTIPLEAQRLGLQAFASDLNPVSVLINKALIEIPPKFAGSKPIGPETKEQKKAKQLKTAESWAGATGLSEDVYRYGVWMRDEAERRIGSLYPQVEITASMASERSDLLPLVGQKLTVVAWLWARTVKSPNPIFSSLDVPLVSTFVLCSKEGKESYVDVLVEGNSYRFSVRKGTPPEEAKSGTKAQGTGSNFRCIFSDTPIGSEYIMSEGQAGRLGTKLMAIVVQAKGGRVYLSPQPEVEALAKSAKPAWKPDVAFLQQALGFRVGNYGMTKWSDLFTARQTLTLTTFCDLIAELRQKIYEDAKASGMVDDGKTLDCGGRGANAYADAVSTMLGLGIGRLANRSSSLNFWDTEGENVQQVFARQTLTMSWEFTEGNPFSNSTGNFEGQLGYLCKAIVNVPARFDGFVFQADAQTQSISSMKAISTDPPYYDNIGYADLSDFFYVWLRHALKPIYPTLLATIEVPKTEELVATPYRHGGKEKAEQFFMSGMTQAMKNLAVQAYPGMPLTIYYAFKQSDTKTDSGTSSTGWETFLEAVHQAGLQLTGTWPVRTEYTGNLKTKRNALASSIVLVCRKRAAKALTVSRREFLRELNAVLPEALDEMTKGSGEDRSPCAPVDLSQAIIGPGMAVFSKYDSVLEADGSAMSVRTALQLINRFLAEDDFDRDTQFCLHWFEQHGWDEGPFGDADTLSRAKGTSVNGVRDAGVIESGLGKVRLKKWTEYPTDWDPKTDTRNPVWETVHNLILTLKQNGETKAGGLLSMVQDQSESVRQLAYRLYTLCERQGWAEDARAYNELITSWTAIESAASAAPAQKQLSVFE